MKKSLFSIVALLFLISCVGCSENSQKNKDLLSDAADAERMTKTMEIITATPRQYGEQNIELSRQFIFETLVEYEYEVTEQEFSYEHNEVIFLDGYSEGNPTEPIEGIHYRFDDVKRTGRNIVAVKKPEGVNKKDEILIVSAHYDSVMDSPGANDNGSGVAALLEIARLVKDLPSSIEVRFIAFDGEEYLLTGSYHYVDNLSGDELSRVIGVINFDMFASANVDDMYMTTIDGRHNYLSEMFNDFILRDKKSTSDHISFVSAAIPVVSISHKAESVNHTPQDTIEHIDKEKLVAAVDKGVEVIRRLTSWDAPSYIKETGIIEDKVFNLQLSGNFPFFENIRTVEDELKISPIQVPVYETDYQQVIMDFAAFVDWWGEPLETHFIYDFMTLSASTFSYIKIMLNDSQQAKDLLNSSFEHIDNVESFYFYYIENEIITESWIDGENAFVIQEKNGHAELIIVPYEKQEITTK